ncbi:MAG: HIRAN domain-containing protein [Thiohalocapsa sp.]|nr:HIRAN domain-containing protein [Thiohalocapsa sp.]MCF7990070.1 HIRAN domain-containing protein [Thiohalocapsa sp.]
MSKLFVAMQDETSRRWAPVARLTRDGHRYRFVYTRGCGKIPDFEAFGRFRDLNTEYVSEELFPLFANRVLPSVRPEYDSYLAWLGLSHADSFEELIRTGGLRATDGLEMIACPEPTEDHRYEIHFFVRGLRYLRDALERVSHLRAGDRLFLMQDVQNPVDGLALMLRTGDPVQLVGYVPRHYSADITRLLGAVGSDAVAVYVDGVNPDAPLHYRLRCRLTAPWPEGFVACGDPEFQPMPEASKDNPSRAKAKMADGQVVAP